MRYKLNDTKKFFTLLEMNGLTVAYLNRKSSLYRSVFPRLKNGLPINGTSYLKIYYVLLQESINIEKYFKKVGNDTESEVSALDPLIIHFNKYLMNNNINFKQAAEHLDISYGYFRSVLLGKYKLTPRIKNKILRTYFPNS